MPSFQQGNFLQENLQSILDQGYPNIEILLADGGSSDETSTVIQKYLPHLTWWVSEPDKGTWDANNKALRQAKGDFIWVLNSDDALLPWAIHTFLTALSENPKGRWFSGKVSAINGPGEEKAVFSPQVQPKRAGLSFLSECWIYHPATIVHRTLAHPYRDTDLLDWDLWIRLEKEGQFPILIDSVLAKLRFHDACKSSDFLDIFKKQLKLLVINEADYLRGSNATERADYQLLKKETGQRLKQAAIKTSAFEGRNLNALVQSLSWAGHQPELFGKRWFWGMVKRIFTGFTLEEVSPLSFLERP